MNVTLDDINHAEIQKLLAPIVYLAILMVVGIPGNLTVLIIYRRRYAKSVYRTIIWNLAFTDLLFCTLTMPFNIGRLIRYYTFENLWICKIFTTVIIFFIMYSSHLLVTLSIHRFRQVCMPLKSQINILNVRYWIVGGFVLAVFLDTPQFILQPIDEVKLPYNLTGHVCAVSFKNSSFAEIYNGFLTFLFGFYAFVLFILYICIGRKMYLQHKIKKNAIATKSIPREDDISGKITKIAITVSAVFAMSYIPLFVLKLLVDVIKPEELNAVQFSILKILERSYAINHVANPFIYAFYDQRFRRQFGTFFVAPWRLKQIESTTGHADGESRTPSVERTLESSLNTNAMIKIDLSKSVDRATM